MAKNKTLILGFLLIISSIGIFSTNACCVASAELVAEIYTGELGVRELTGRNDGKRIEEYLATTGHKKGAPWCAAFVTWVFVQADVEAVRSAWSPSWFPASKTIYTRGGTGNKSPAKADVFGLWFQNLKRVAHVGFIHDWQRNTQHVVTVEGNTNDAGSREGDGVYRKRRLKSQIYKVSRWI